MTFRRAHVLALALGAGGAGLGAVAAGAGCSSFDAAPAADAGSGLGDASASGDGTTTSDSAAQVDAGEPCSDHSTVIFGTPSLKLSGRASDFITAQWRDAHFFTAEASGNARCAWLYIVKPPTQGVVHFGLYADRSGVPDTLLARARFDKPVAGWNSAPLASSVVIAAGQAMWIGVGPDKDTVTLTSVLDAGCDTQSFTGKLNAGVALADPFLGTTTYPSCDLAAYLGP